MPGYNPNCPNCHKCPTCRGDGTIDTTKSERGIVHKVRVTCPACDGRGGKPGPGPHNHR
jgi:DnaJ-class molecular chaperone